MNIKNARHHNKRKKFKRLSYSECHIGSQRKISREKQKTHQLACSSQGHLKPVSASQLATSIRSVSDDMEVSCSEEDKDDIARYRRVVAPCVSVEPFESVFLVAPEKIPSCVNRYTKFSSDLES